MGKKLRLLIVAMVLISVACDDKSVSEEECMLYKISWIMMTGTEYELEGITTCTYGDQNQLSEVLQEYGSYSNSNIFNYDEQGRVNTVTLMNEDRIIHRQKFSWGDNTVEHVYQTVNDSGNWEDNLYLNKLVYQLDSDGKIILKERYTNNGFGWDKSIDYSEYEWSNGNNNKTKDFITTDWKVSGIGLSMIPQYLPQSNQRKSTNDLLDCTTSYEYDDNKNIDAPWGIVSEAIGLNANNITSSTQSYVGSEETYTITHAKEYNDKGYPTKNTRTYKWEGVEIKDVSTFEYICK